MHWELTTHFGKVGSGDLWFFPVWGVRGRGVIYRTLSSRSPPCPARLLDRVVAPSVRVCGSSAAPGPNAQRNGCSFVTGLDDLTVEVLPVLELSRLFLDFYAFL